MDIEVLVQELTSHNPNIEIIREILNKNADLINGILVDNGSALHHAARNDTLYGTKITQILLEEFSANPNFQNSSGSIPIFWGLAASEEAKSIGLTPYWESIRILLMHPWFKINKELIYRGNIFNFLLKEYKSKELNDLIQEAIWKKRLPMVYLKQELYGFSLV